MPAIYLPAPAGWSPDEVVTAPQLRADVSGTIQLLSRPPFFTGTQTMASQTISSGTLAQVTLDTEVVDSLGGHSTVTSPGRYFAMFDGWYLAEGTVSLDYTGGAGSFAVGIAAHEGGVVSDYVGGQVPNSSGPKTTVSMAKLVHMTQVGTFAGASNDYVALLAYQDTGSNKNLDDGTNTFPELSVIWVCASSGTASLEAPSIAPFAPPSTTLTAGISAGATSVTPADTTGMTFYNGLGGTLGLDIGTDIAEDVVMTGPVSGGSVPVTATVYAHASGAPVAVPVQAAFLNKHVRDVCRFLIYPPIMEYSYTGNSQTLASQTSVPATGNTITLATATVDNYSAFASNTWTAPVDGLYYCYGQLALATALNGETCAAGLTVNSANYNSGTTFTMWGGSVTSYAALQGQTCATVTRRLRLNAGDTVKLAGFQHDSGANAETVLGATQSSRLLTVWQGN